MKNNWGGPSVEVLRVFLQGAILLAAIGSITFLGWAGVIGSPAVMAVLGAAVGSVGTAAGATAVVAAVKRNANGNGNENENGR